MSKYEQRTLGRKEELEEGTTAGLLESEGKTT
jgi:hypothetical protein